MEAIGFDIEVKQMGVTPAKDDVQVMHFAVFMGKSGGIVLRHDINAHVGSFAVLELNASECKILLSK